MSAPPEGIPALGELRESLRAAARRDVEAPTVRRRHRRRAGGLLAAGALVAAGAAGAAELILTGEPVKDTRRGIVAGYRPGPGREQLSVVARDPDGGPAWGVKVFISRNHRRCAIAGVVNGVALGTLSGGRFHPYPADLAGTCARTGRPFGAVQRVGDRTLVFGLARPGVRRVTIAVGGRQHPAQTGRGDAFLAVYRGEVASDELNIDYGA
jgi:hypothetical protein